MAQEWRGLRDAEKNRFYENYAEKSDVYSKELQALKDRALQKKRESKAAAKAAAKATS